MITTLVIKEILQHPIKCILFVLGFVVAITFAVILSLSALMGAVAQNPCDNSGGGSSDSGSDVSSDISGASGAWTQKGTKAYNLAKAIFQEGVHLGMNSIEAAGMVGNAEQEGAAQGNLKQPEEDGSGDGGEGIFQFTGGTKTSYLSWCSKNHESAWTVASEVKGIFGCYGKSPQEYINQKPGDLSHAAFQFYKDVEDPGATYAAGAGGNRTSNANQAYKMFKGLGGASDDTGGTASSGESDSSCGSSGGGGDSADGTGSVKEKPGCNSIYDPDHVPSDMKQYIHDPRDDGLHYKSASGWSDPGDQCVNFSISYFHKIWGTKQGTIMGNGIDIAGGWSKVMSGSMSSTPHAGADASTSYTGFTAGNSCGHTFVVEHVLANGDYIIAEENWPDCNGSKGSGSDNGTSDDWDYALIPKNTPSTHFFLPSSSKYHAKWNS